MVPVMLVLVAFHQNRSLFLFTVSPVHGMVLSTQ